MWKHKRFRTSGGGAKAARLLGFAVLDHSCDMHFGRDHLAPTAYGQREQDENIRRLPKLRA